MSALLGYGQLGTLPVSEGVGLPVEPVDIEVWVGLLPESARAVLAGGPVNDDVEHARPCCTICRAVAMCEPGNVGADFLLAWHAEEKRPELAGHEYEAAASYLRCVYAYLVAGWDGVQAPDPDVCVACTSCGVYFPRVSAPVGEDCYECGGELVDVEFEPEEKEANGDPVIRWAA